MEFLMGSNSKQDPNVANVDNTDGLTRLMVQTFSSYAAAPLWERRCVFAVAARTDPAELQQFRANFRTLDIDGDGTISRDDLAAFVKTASTVLSGPVDVDTLFDAADLARTGFVSFVEYSAACLHGRLCPLDCWLAEQAFEAIDIDRDGMISACDVNSMFGDIPARLPVDRPVGIREWTRYILNETSSNTSICVRKPSLVEVVFGACGPQNVQPSPASKSDKRSVSEAFDDLVTVNDACVPLERTRPESTASLSTDTRPWPLESSGSESSIFRAKRARQQPHARSGCRPRHGVLCLSSPSYVPVLVVA
eukprot:TRINITY_DN3776_c0_g1_i2.p1 TRINITY_DN3776_c0_g1~~TRINITY_DN3776_c0_g1_i2.p1  ORF type:complete len:343 (-),score=39.34 TRINITY_DN3776_c0_g1_i2:184-1107(-)